MAQPETSGKVLRSGYIEMSPFSFTDKDGNATGVINQFQRQLIRAAGYEWQAKPFPIKRMVKSVVEGEVDVYIGFLHQWDDASIFVSEQIELTIVEFISSSSLGVIHYFFLENVGRNY